MANNGKETMAQAVFMAQIAASNGKCNCKACQCLRKAGDSMVDEFLFPAAPAAGNGVEAAISQIMKTGLPETVQEV